MTISPRRALLFVRAYACLLLIHRAIERGGFKGAQGQFLREWKPRSRDIEPGDPRARDIEWAVQQACAWQWKRSVCLHRALATYALLRAAGAQPRFVMAIANHPFASHAWTELGGHPLADAAMDESRYLYKPVLRLPKPLPAP